MAAAPGGPGPGGEDDDVADTIVAPGRTCGCHPSLTRPTLRPTIRTASTPAPGTTTSTKGPFAADPPVPWPPIPGTAAQIPPFLGQPPASLTMSHPPAAPPPPPGRPAAARAARPPATRAAGPGHLRAGADRRPRRTCVLEPDRPDHRWAGLAARPHRRRRPARPLAGHPHRPRRPRHRHRDHPPPPPPRRRPAAGWGHRPGHRHHPRRLLDQLARARPTTPDPPPPHRLRLPTRHDWHSGPGTGAGATGSGSGPRCCAPPAAPRPAPTARPPPTPRAPGGCAHTTATPAYRPTTKIRDYVTARDQTCRHPRRRQPARHADLDHTLPCAQGRPDLRVQPRRPLPHATTRSSNFPAGPSPSPRPGHFELTTPAGRTYTTTPDPYLN